MDNIFTTDESNRLDQLHQKLEDNGWQRSKLSKNDANELLALEQKWTDAVDFNTNPQHLAQFI